MLVAETLLRRTRARQVEDRIAAVLEKYPTPAAMARTDIDEIRADLYSFGLRWRADNLATLSRVISNELAGKVPGDLTGLMQLPGVGSYVAAATLAAVSSASVVLIDTNTVRVASRVHGIHGPGDIRRRPAVVAAIRRLLGGPAPASDWWAVLDLAATVCHVTDPNCTSCPIRATCTTGLTPGALQA